MTIYFAWGGGQHLERPNVFRMADILEFQNFEH